METKEFIKYMEIKGFAPITQKLYLTNAQRFFKWAKVQAEQVTKPDILRYLEYLKNKKGVQNRTRQIHLYSINHYFKHLYKEAEIDKNPCNFLKLRGVQVKKLYNLYTGEELSELYDNYYNFYIRNFQTCKFFGKGTEEYIKMKRARNLVAIGIMVYQGTLASELKNIRLEDINLQKGTIKITSSKRAKERILSLNAAQIGSLIDYLQNIKPKLEVICKTNEYENFLFSTENQTFETDIIKNIVKQIKQIDRKFKSFSQIRTSVITNWLKTNGLRKTQYLAGHRSIGCTERYKPNNLENLIDDINNMHPFN